MSQQTVCDNDLCDSVFEEFEDHDQMWWLRIGWRDSQPQDACSSVCARAIVEELQHRRWAVEEQSAAETAEGAA